MAVWLVPVIVFVLVVGTVLAVYAGVTYLPGALLRRRVESRLRGVSGPPEVAEAKNGEAGILKRDVQGPLPGLDRLAARTAQGSALSTLIQQSGVKASVSGTVLTAVLLAAAGGVIGAGVFHLAWAGLAGGVIGLAAPFLFLRRRRAARLARFEEQFPEALDLLSRAIRAGHAFTTAVGMVADEGPDPVGPEFRKCFDEQNFGLPLKDALNALAVRIPLLDVRFFVTAVLIQRETGGNLSEILDNLAHVVRERFKILRQVRVYTAHGRLTGYVLMALPAALAIVLSFINAEHMNVLFRERMGQMMLTAAIVLQIVGYVWIKQVVKIEV
jgi:tight adherence protein B